MEFFRVGLKLVQIQQIVMPLVPGRIANFGQLISIFAVLSEVIDVERAEVEAKIAQVDQAENIAFNLGDRLSGKLGYF